MAGRPLKKSAFFNKGGRRLQEGGVHESFESTSEGGLRGLNDPDEPLLEAPGYEDDSRYDQSYGGGAAYYPEPQRGSSDFPEPYDPNNPDDPAAYTTLQQHRYPEEDRARFQESEYAEYGATGFSPPPEEGSFPSTSGHQDPPRSGQKGKRAQTCRLCANHGIVVEKKGHKPFCRYQTPHDCRLCEVTLRMRDASAAQQKMTRNQQPSVQVPPQRPLNPGPREFPRMQELEEETRDIIDTNLFEDINEIVRSRSQQP